MMKPEVDPEQKRRSPRSTFLTVVLVVCTLLTFSAPNWWLGELVSNLRIQGLIAIVTVGLACGVQRLPRHSAVLLACLVVNAWWLLPGDSVISRDANAKGLRVCTANLLTSNRNYESIVHELLRSNADVIGIPELSFGHEATFESDEFKQAYPYSVKAPSNNGNFGIGLYSKRPLTNGRLRDFPEDGILSVTADVDLNGRPCHVIATHVLAPMNSSWYQVRRRHLDGLAAYVCEQRKQHPTTPVIVFGDFNLTPWSPLLYDFLNDSGLKRTSASLKPTWHGLPTFVGGLHLDLILATDDLVVGPTEIGQPMGSDHLSVTADFDVGKKKARSQKVPGS